MSSVELVNVTKGFGDVPVLHGVSMEAESGEFVVLLGPSGCGKSTSLRIMAGLERADGGDVLIEGERVNHLPAAKRQTAMVFQNYALYPHLNVAENIIFGLKVRKVERAERDTRLREVAGMLDLTPYLERKPAELSGGQRQRVALGRALVSKAKIILMDEPLSNLDAKLRQQMRVDLRALQRELGLTVIYVTHDQVEAMTMADRVIVMREGNIEQVATPVELYQSPATAWVAKFIGSPPMNLVPGRVHDGALVLEAAGAGAPDGDVLVGFRPEDVRIDGEGDLLVRGTVRSVEILGAETLVALDIGSTDPLVVRVPGIAARAVGSEATAAVSSTDIALFDRESGQRAAQPDDSREAAIREPTVQPTTERGNSHV